MGIFGKGRGRGEDAKPGKAMAPERAEPGPPPAPQRQNPEEDIEVQDLAAIVLQQGEATSTAPSEGLPPAGGSAGEQPKDAAAPESDDLLSIFETQAVEQSAFRGMGDDVETVSISDLRQEIGEVTSLLGSRISRGRAAQ